MNNSDIISALSLALTAIIFLMQSDDSLLRTKIRKRDNIVIVLATISIILLTNYQIFERFDLEYYFSLGGFYLTPGEWALVIFLAFIGIGLYRLLKPKIFNNNPVVLLDILQKYRTEKKLNKLQELIFQIMELPDFEESYGAILNDSIFNDHQLIEYFASNYPDVLIDFTEKYSEATLNRGEHLYYIFNGLFADKSNLIFSEIRQYATEPTKGDCISDWEYYMRDFVFAPEMDYKTDLPLINWLTQILKSFPSRLKENTSIFLSQYGRQLSENNGFVYSGDHITTSLSRDSVYNILQLFRIMLIEISFTDKRIKYALSRVLLLQYSSWDFIDSATVLTKKVQLDNDAYSINEYFLKYLFDTYCMIYIINKRIAYTVSKKIDEDEDIGWSIKQLFNKLDGLWAGERVSKDSKTYYINRLLDLYFDLPAYFSDDYLEDTEETILYYFKESLTDTPYGNPISFGALFRNVCEHREFYRQNNEHTINIVRAKKLYNYLQPFTQGLERYICDK